MVGDKDAQLETVKTIMSSETTAKDTATALDLRRAEPSFAEQIGAEPGCDTLVNCFQCGLCTGTCPVSELDERFSPAWIIQWVRLGLRQTVLASPLIWYCLQCHRCSFHCPQGVRFADIDEALRARAIEEGFISRDRVRQLAVLEEQWKRARLSQLDLFFQGETRAATAAQTGVGSAGASAGATEAPRALPEEPPATPATAPPPSAGAVEAAEATAEAAGSEGEHRLVIEEEEDGGEKAAIDGEDLDWGAADDSRFTTHDPDSDSDSDSDPDTDSDADADPDSDADKGSW